ncbi:NAD(P)-binding protein [Cylindrobasidium torrendii FP15055 ss-10]|uniref:NAD(P)-binding protein n=1 Tax=Cylindrobasidium torrendii FP15055 ss-10 TaxID=1314674 RepID=A0A0D7BNN6_9AGAR|nr:NAD(P)-binding protein [Cylindrobasidium torrendii FP15055 ss-10]
MNKQTIYKQSEPVVLRIKGTSTMSKLSVLIIGATGYLGGSVLTRLLDYPKLSLTALVRSAEKAQKIRDLKLGVRVVEGSPSTDAALLVELMADVDILIDAYNCDDLTGALNILAATRQSKKRVHVIHVSGTALLSDYSFGKSPAQAKYSDYDDTDIEQLRSIPATALHNNVDQEFLKADAEGHIYTYLFVPGAIFSQPTGVLVDAGIVKPQEMMIYMIVASLELTKGVPGFIGDGLNEWAIVDIHETTDLMLLMINKLLGGETLSHGIDGYYFVENGTVQLKELAVAAAKEFSGVVPSEARPFTPEEQTAVFKTDLLTNIVASNTGCRSTRGRALGWKPTKGRADFLEVAESYAKKARQ